MTNLVALFIRPIASREINYSPRLIMWRLSLPGWKSWYWNSWCRASPPARGFAYFVRACRSVGAFKTSGSFLCLLIALQEVPRVPFFPLSVLEKRFSASCAQSANQNTNDFFQKLKRLGGVVSFTTLKVGIVTSRVWLSKLIVFRLGAPLVL